MVTANPGQAAAKIAKVASGGELSRISLAIQVVTAQYNQTASIIFDEIDVGVGGKIAEMRTGEGKTLVATLPAYLNAAIIESCRIFWFLLTVNI